MKNCNAGGPSRLVSVVKCLLIAAGLMSFVGSGDSSQGHLIYSAGKKTFKLSLKYAYFVTGPDAFDGQKIIRRLIFTEKDIALKIKECGVMNCVDPLIEGIQIDLDAAPRLLYWVNLNNGLTQYSGTQVTEAMTLSKDTQEALAGTLNFDNSAAGGPVVDVKFEATRIKAFSKHR